MLIATLLGAFCEPQHCQISNSAVKTIKQFYADIGTNRVIVLYTNVSKKSMDFINIFEINDFFVQV